MNASPTAWAVSSLVLWAVACGPGLDEGTYRTARLDEPCTLQLHCVQALTCGTQQRCIELGDVPRQWGSRASDAGTEVAVDPAGGIVVSGVTGGSLDLQPNLRQGDAFLTRFAADGTKLWTRQWGTEDTDAAWSVAVAGDGSIYAAGFVHGGLDLNVGAIDPPADAFLAKFDVRGVQIWMRQWGKPHLDTRALAVAVTDAGVYVVGSDEVEPDGSGAGQTDAFIRKYAADGSYLWEKRLGSPEIDFAHGVAVDVTGNAYVTGPTYGQVSSDPSHGDSDVFLTKYGPDGEQAWVRQWGTAGADFAQATVVDADGAAYLAGLTGGNLGASLSGERDAFIMKVGVDGVQQWTRQWGSDRRDEATALLIDQGGDLWVTGQTLGEIDDAVPLGEFDVFVSHFDSAGQRLTTTIQGTTATDSASGIAQGPDGKIYVVGRTGGSFAGSSQGQYDIILTHP